MHIFSIFQFENEMDEIVIFDEITLIDPKLSNDTNNYIIKRFGVDKHSNGSSFGIQISFERNAKGVNGILTNYHLMCAMLVLVASTNFVFDAKDSNRSCMLIALLLVQTSYFSAAQVLEIL